MNEWMNEWMYFIFSSFWSFWTNIHASITTRSTEYNYIQVNKTVNFCPLQELATLWHRLKKKLVVLLFIAALRPFTQHAHSLILISRILQVCTETYCTGINYNTCSPKVFSRVIVVIAVVEMVIKISGTNLWQWQHFTFSSKLGRTALN